MTERVIAVVPVRSFRHGKTRLGPALDQSARARLMRHMAERVTAALAASSSIESTAVISPDPDVLAWAAGLPHSVLVVEQAQNAMGLDAAIDLGRQLALQAGADAMLSLFADLPLVTARDVAALIADQAAVVLGSDRRGTGTNGLLLRFSQRSREFSFFFGAGSLARHRAEAQRIGLLAHVLDIPGIAFDLDTPDDWSDLLAADAADGRTRGGRPLECGARAR